VTNRIAALKIPWLPLAALIALIAATAVIDRVQSGDKAKFLSLENTLNVLHGQSPEGVVAVGMTAVIMTAGIDLSVGGMAAMSAVIGLLAMRAVGNSPVALLAGVVAMLGVGLVAGAINGILVAKGKLAPFIATLGGFAAYRSVAEALADGGPIRSPAVRGEEIVRVIDKAGLPLGWLHHLGIPSKSLMMGEYPAVLTLPILIFAAIAVLAAVVLNRTRFGRHVVAVGGNERAAIYSAVNAGFVKWLTYTLLGLCVGIGAVLSVANSGGSSETTGNMYELDAIAAVVIGGTRLSGGRGSIAGTVIGILILGVIDNMLTFLDVNTHWQGAFKGGIIVAAALLQQVGRKSR
jgi:ribose transport system permease protein